MAFKPSFGVRAACAAGVGGLTVGYDLGVISGALPLLHDALGLTPLTEGLLVAMASLGHLPGAPVGGYCADRFGRKRTMYGANVLFVIGSLVVASSGSLGVLLVGRFLVGFAVACNITCNIPWVSEVVPRDARGGLTTVYELFVTGGVFLSFVTYLVAVMVGGAGFWRVLFGMAAAFAILQMVLMAPFPESPAWLVTQGRTDDAQAALLFVFSGDELAADEELQRLQTESQRATHAVVISSAVTEASAAVAPAPRPARGPASRGLSTMSSTESDDEIEIRMAQPSALTPSRTLLNVAPAPAAAAPRAAEQVLLKDWQAPLALYVSIILFGFLTGGLSVRTFAPLMFADMKFGARGAAMATVGLGFVKVCSTSFAILYIERIGRRPLLLGGTTLMLVAAAVMVLGMAGWSRDAATTDANTPSGIETALCILGAVLYTIAYQLSYGPLGFVAVEMFPSAIRARVISGMDALGNAIIAAMSQGFPLFVQAGGYTLAFSVHLALCVLALGVGAAFFVETRALEPSAIRAAVQKRNGDLRAAWRSRGYGGIGLGDAKRAVGNAWDALRQIGASQRYENLPEDTDEEAGRHKAAAAPRLSQTKAMREREGALLTQDEEDDLVDVEVD